MNDTSSHLKLLRTLLVMMVTGDKTRFLTQYKVLRSMNAELPELIDSPVDLMHDIPVKLKVVMEYIKQCMLLGKAKLTNHQLYDLCAAHYNIDTGYSEIINELGGYVRLYAPSSEVNYFLNWGQDKSIHAFDNIKPLALLNEVKLHVIEECSELTKEIIKTTRAGIVDNAGLHEELADVEATLILLKESLQLGDNRYHEERVKFSLGKKRDVIQAEIALRQSKDGTLPLIPKTLTEKIVATLPQEAIAL